MIKENMHEKSQTNHSFCSMHASLGIYIEMFLRKCNFFFIASRIEIQEVDQVFTGLSGLVAA